MQQRQLGKTGLNVSIIAFGGIVVTDAEPADASRSVAEAVDRGVNYFDVAPSYGDAEIKLGPALEPYRNQVHLACKTGKRDKAGAAAELRQSLKHLRTDHFDVYQLHALSKMEELEQVLGPDGALEAFLEARDAGLIRHIGFSAHSSEVAVEAIKRFDFDTVLFPINYVLYHEANFGPAVVEAAQQKNMGRLALKAMARTHWAQGEEKTAKKCWYKPIEDPHEAALALRFTLSEPIAIAIPPGEAKFFRMALDIAEKFEPLTDAERRELEQSAGGVEPIFKLAA
ncbi:MAG: aldo/keto reductase [Abitibacteriaceae bacterium]|nr:aldo/keto reductase [Abditibacteriaceae bacterium]